MNHSTPILGALFFATLAPMAAAQMQRSIPSIYAQNEGNDLASYPFGWTGFRVQQIVRSTSIAQSLAIINGISYRADNDNSGTKPAVTFPNLTLSLGPTTHTPESMTTTYANNITSPLTQVFSGPLSLPAYTSTSGGVAPWAQIAISTPFTYATTQGNLLIDITAPVASPVTTSYTIDCALPGGTWSSFGKAGSNSTNDGVNLTAAGNGTQGRYSGVVPGGTATILVASMFQAWSGVMVFGVSEQNPPFDLAPFGAPGHSLYVWPVVTAPFTLQAFGFQYRATFPIAIPAGTTGAQLFSQAVLSDPTNNTLGVAVTAAQKLTVGEPLPHPVQQLQNKDYTATTGVFQYGTSNLLGGAVVRISGVLQ